MKTLFDFGLQPFLSCTSCSLFGVLSVSYSLSLLVFVPPPITVPHSLFSIIEYRQSQLPNLFSAPSLLCLSPSLRLFVSLSLSLPLAFTGGSQGAVCGCPHHTVVKHKPIVSPNWIIPAFTADPLPSRSLSLSPSSLRPFIIFILSISSSLSLSMSPRTSPLIFTPPVPSHPHLFTPLLPPASLPALLSLFFFVSLVFFPPDRLLVFSHFLFSSCLSDSFSLLLVVPSHFLYTHTLSLHLCRPLLLSGHCELLQQKNYKCPPSAPYGEPQY